MRRATLDSSFSARIVARRPMLYTAGADAAQDRPAFVRAGSGIAWVGDRLAVVQDDAHFVALVHPETGAADVVALPADAKGRRLFDDSLGLKHLKMDLESCFARADGSGITLTALGSGSTERRTRIVQLHFPTPRATPAVRVREATALYAALKDERRFSGSALNVEGALVRGDELLLFQRGNGASSADDPAVNAIGKLSFAAFERYLAGKGPAPTLTEVTQYDLGHERGVPYGFTDATHAADGAILFLASAEDSESTVSDGAVLGTLIGRIDAAGDARMIRLYDENGAPSRLKAEAMAIDPSDSRHAFVVIDVDDPAKPSELLEVRVMPIAGSGHAP